MPNFMSNGFVRDSSTLALVVSGLPAAATSGYARAMATNTALAADPTVTDQGSATLPGSGALTAATQKTIASAVGGAFNPAAPFRYNSTDTFLTGAFVDALGPTTNVARAKDTSWPLRVEFDFDGSIFALWHFTTVNTRWRLWANEQVMSAFRSGYASANQYTMVDFGSAAQRRIVIEYNANVASFEGILIPKTASATPPSARASLKFAHVGDSYVAGQGIDSFNNSIQGYHHTLYRLLGFTSTRNLGVGGTGFVQTSGSSQNYMTRLGDLLSYQPDVVLVQGSINDNSFVGAGLGAAATAYLTALRAGLPGSSRIVVTSPLRTPAPGANDVAGTAELKAVCSALGIPFIDAVTNPWFTGTGRVGATTGDGNADFYHSSVSVTHPSLAGHDYLARRMAPEVASALGYGL